MAQNFCTSCGRELSAGARFCSSCGAPVGSTSASPAAVRPVSYEIQGDNLQVLRIRLEPGQEVYAEAGKMVYKTANVNMETKMIGSSLGEKVLGALKRAVAGESLFTTHYTAANGTGEVGFAGEYPGRIQAISLAPGKAFLAQRDSFVCAESSVGFSIALVKNIGAGIFGGEGFILEKFTGPGTVFLHGGGDFVIFDLAPGEVMQVDTGSVVGFADTVEYDIEFVSGIKTAIFGGEGLFLTTLRGPGKAIVQTMTIAKLRRELGAKTGGEERSGFGALGGTIGSED